MEEPEGLGVNRDIHAENATLDLEREEDQAGSVRVRVEDSWFTVERALLARYSNYFCALFQSGMIESHRDELHLKGGVRARGFLIALAVCRGEVPTISDPDELVEAVECAAFLQIACLVQHLCDIIDSDNCLLLYQAASIFGAHTHLQWNCYMTPLGLFATLTKKRESGKHLTDLPTLCSTSMAGVAVLDNRLYIVGGVYGYGKDTVDGSFCYNPETGVWTALPGPKQPRYDFTLLGYNGRLYAIGGEFKKRIISTAECYDTEKEEWTFIQHAPRPVASAACAVARRRMFVCFWKPPDTTDIYEYIPVTDEWKLATTMIKPQSYGHCMVAHRDNLYVMRNGPCDDFLRCLMDCYNITTGQWTALPGHYINSKGALFSAMIRGDSAFTVKHMLTLEYTITDNGWKPRRQMKGFPKSGSLWTCLLRLPKMGPAIPQLDAEGKEEEIALPDTSEAFAEAILQL
ncbi:Kelch repeat and BTB domain-containing protein 13 [Larimichthys crocea]|uniref:Kelch repeat and BTB domain-containing protein 13 n=1 Tax=Larimichthys crocea TaxID=215358 RepID=A0A6G0HYE6_LARCR|nr:Kelch repeat and BTB domain-containing protein 13 [Larimichthys crocea]